MTAPLAPGGSGGPEVPTLQQLREELGRIESRRYREGASAQEVAASYGSLVERLFARAEAAERERDNIVNSLQAGSIQARYRALAELAGPNYRGWEARPVEAFVKDRMDALQARVAALEHCVAAGVTYHNSIQVPHGCSCDWCQIARPLLK